ncbi:MAG: phosphate/phosphite/phosphonate ABC transporter substrate-binding protein, partial [bacterium]
KGFSVVADEIKDLAERTSFSTQEIATLINTVRQEVAESVVAMDEGVKTVEDGFALANNSDESLKKIVESAHKSSEMSVAIERATEQQAKAVKLVGESMEKVKQMIASIVRATTEQRKGASLIIATTEKVRDFTAQVKNASEEQATSSKQISKAMEIVSEKTHQISSALREQKVGASNIQVAVEKISQLPDQNRERAMVLNRSLKDLSRDSELVMTEMRRFRFQEASSLDVITFGIVPLESPSEMHRKFSPLARYLGEKTGKHVDIKVAGNFAEAVSDISKGVAQVSFMSPSTYIQAHAEADVRVIAIAVRSGKSYYHSVVVASPKKSIERIEDLRGKTFAFGDVNSTSSHIVPRYMLKEAGITLNDLQYYNHLAMHDDVAEAVLAGDFDGGGVMEKTALKYKERGLRLIKYSAEIPDFNICVSKNLGQHEENRILQALLDLGEGNPESASILNAIDRTYTGFARANDADYDGIRDIMKKLGML